MHVTTEKNPTILKSHRMETVRSGVVLGREGCTRRAESILKVKLQTDRPVWAKEHAESQCLLNFPVNLKVPLKKNVSKRKLEGQSLF